MALYDDLVNANIMGPLMPYLDRGALRIELYPKKVIKLGQRYQHEGSWVYFIYPDDRRGCGLWWNVYYSIYKMIPRNCYNCWKVYTVIPTVRKAIAIEKAFRDWLPGKIGPERRPWTGRLGNFMAFWYTPFGEGLEGGRRLLQRVRKKMQKEFGDVAARAVHLKRGCSEFERDFGPSDKWPWPRPEVWNLREDLADTLFEIPQYDTLRMFGPARTERLQQWIEYAFEHGDQTYLDFVSKKFSMDYVRYDGSIHRDEDFSYLKYSNVESFEKGACDESDCDGSELGEGEEGEGSKIITLGEGVERA